MTAALEGRHNSWEELLRLVSASELVSDGKSPLIGVTVALDARELSDLEAAGLDHLN
ncbi:MAG: hypothetical protein JWL70_1531, partial [Acidimicrobiia bacterium]|nr:hypothetical protein [Acidimicrobiia bacterium]